MKKQKKYSRGKENEKKIAEIKKDRKKAISAINKKYLEEKILFTVNFFKELGRVITRDEAIDLMKQMENLPAYKEYQAEIQPLIKNQVYLEKELESVQSMIDEETAKLRDLEKVINKLKS